MPKMVQIRNVPDDLHAELKARAAKAGMSLSEFLLRELEVVASRVDHDDLFARARSRQGGVPVQEIVAAIREGRDGR